MFCLCVMLAAGAACGNAQTTSPTSQKFAIKPGSIGSCLQHGGAERAASTSDLGFLRDAESNEEISESGFALDRRSRLFVNVWTATTREGRPPRWVIWYGQPFDSNLSPFEILESAESRGYVMFLNSPGRDLRRRTNACIRF